MKENKILNRKNINDANRRMAFQIYESNIDLKEIYLIGISKNGVILSNRIGDFLKNISFISESRFVVPFQTCIFCVNK